MTTALTAGTKLGPFLIEGLLGQGGFGQVYRALQQGPEGFSRTVALKVLSQTSARSDRHLRLFYREARLVAQLQHPNIVTVYDLVQSGEHHLLVMEFIDGLSLAKLIESRPRLPLHMVLHIGVEIGRALCYAHGFQAQGSPTRGIIHRDVKPSNILLGSRGEVKLSDFGLARTTEATSESQSLAGPRAGTPGYMSPEQLMGSASSPAADVFSLGVLIYQLLRGYAYQDLLRDRQGPLPSLHTTASSVPESLATLVAAATASKVSERPDARSLVDGLVITLRRVLPAEQIDRLGEELSRLVQAVRNTTARAVTALGGHTLSLQAGPQGDVLQPRFLEQSLPTAAEPAMPPPPPAASASPGRSWASRRLLAAILATFVLGLAFGFWALRELRKGEPSSHPGASRQPADARAKTRARDAAPPRDKAGEARLVRGPPPAAQTDAALASDIWSGATVRRKHGRRHPRSVRASLQRTSSAAAASRSSGFLSLNVDPWAEVFVDGVRVGFTPIWRSKLAAGRHRLRLVGPRGRTTERTVWLGREQHLNLGLLDLP